MILKIKSLIRITPQIIINNIKNASKKNKITATTTTRTTIIINNKKHNNNNFKKTTTTTTTTNIKPASPISNKVLLYKC